MKLTQAILETPRRPSPAVVSRLLLEAPKTAHAWRVCMWMIVLCFLFLPAQAQTPATGIIGINGSDQTSDAGMVHIVVNGNDCVGYYNPGDVDATLAISLANMINSCSPFVSAAVGGSALGPGGVPYAWTIHLTSKTSGSNTNYPMSTSIVSDYYLQPPFAVVPFAATLTGGTDAPAPIPGFINPKYIIVGVTYAPPGAQSTVSYLNSKLVGNTTDISHAFSDTTTVAVTISAGIKGWVAGIDAQAHVAGTETTSFTHGSSDSHTVTISKTTAQTDLTRGPANSFVGIDHDFDIVWLWLNPLLMLSYDPNTPTPSPGMGTALTRTTNLMWTFFPSLLVG